MTFIIHRGANEIGGLCVEVFTEKTRLVIDIGMPLVNKDSTRFDSETAEKAPIDELRGKNFLPDIPALYEPQAEDKETALLISHAHQDHYGLISYIDKNIPVYIGKAGQKLIELAAVFAGGNFIIENPRRFESYKPFNFGDITITPYPMDHAAFDAYAFLVQAGGESLFYSGDFRSHGRKSKLFYKFLHVAPKNADYLLLEGTTLSRSKEKFPTEEQLERQFVKTFRETKGINLVFVSGQNIDRLVTIFRACRERGKIFAVDFYIANVLSALAELGYGVPHPSVGFPKIRVFFPERLRRRMEHLNRNDLIDRYKKYEINPEEINEKSKNIVMTIRASMGREINQIQDISDGTLIYSMWDGYKEKADTERFLSDISRRGATITNIHTSGHADLFTLRKMAEAVQPKELIPVHTTESDRYQEYFPDFTVRQVADSEIVGGKEVQILTLFEHIEELGTAHGKTNALPGSGFEDFTRSVRPHIDFICEKLKISEIQAVLFADIACLFSGYDTSMKEIAEHIGCATIKVMKYVDDFKILEDNNLLTINKINRHGNNTLSFSIGLETLDALRKGAAPDMCIYENLSLEDFFIQLAKLLENRVQRRVNYTRTIKILNTLLENNRHLTIVKEIKSYALLPDDELILLYFWHYLVNYDEESMELHMVEKLYEDNSEFITARRQLKAGNHILQKKDLIQNVNDDGFGMADSLCLSDKAKEELLCEIDEQLVKKSAKGIKPANEIPEKKLFYPEKTAKQISELTSLLCEENFAAIRKRLSGESMRNGFACLFSGLPGTGKTETVYQIARETGRGIMQVDISDTKSMWFGESEKKIKALFTRYRSVVKRSDIIPILLFNEADAVIGKRRNLGENRDSLGQTENTIQNIILSEIENLDGILIATTNLATNMDKAFERRFLYKIEFEKPSFDARKSIWQALIPGLSPDNIGTLAGMFDFSGGQIENIARRRAVAEMLYGVPPSLDTLIEYCKDEIAEKAEKRKIGFLHQTSE